MTRKRTRTRLRGKWEWVDRLTTELNAAHGQGDTRQMFELMRQLGMRDVLTKARVGMDTVADPVQERDDWKEHFRRLQGGA